MSALRDLSWAVVDLETSGGRPKAGWDKNGTFHAASEITEVGLVQLAGSIRQIPADEAVTNPAFDVTPAKWISAIVTERGSCPATAAGLHNLYPEARHA